MGAEQTPTDFHDNEPDFETSQPLDGDATTTRKRLPLCRAVENLRRWHEAGAQHNEFFSADRVFHLIGLFADRP